MIVTLLTDYGHEDELVGVCHGVIAAIAPQARVIDLTHGIPRFGVRQGALALRDTLPFMPVGVHVAIVDPQVGTQRRAVALRTDDGRLMVGPDNGLLSLAWEAAGGIELAVDVSRSAHRLEPLSATFHGRDLFAPVAAQLAAGAELADAGDPIDPATLERVELPVTRVDGDALIAHVLSVDRYGNAGLDAGHAQLAEAGLKLGTIVEIEAGGERFLATPAATFADVAGGERFLATRAATFADVAAGELILYEDAYRRLALAINRGDAARTVGLADGGELRLAPR